MVFLHPVAYGNGFAKSRALTMAATLIAVAGSADAQGMKTEPVGVVGRGQLGHVGLLAAADDPPAAPAGKGSEGAASKDGPPELPPLNTKPTDTQAGASSKPAGEGTEGSSSEDGPPALPPLNNNQPDTQAGGNTKPAGDGFVDSAALEALTGGVHWHGFFQHYSSVGIRGGFRRDLLQSEDRLQLEFESEVGPLRIIGRPQLIYDGVGKDLHVAFRELYAQRLYKNFDLTVGERILTWGITDFWPVVDILNPRDFSQFRLWRPIDEKLPSPVIHSTAVFGRFTLQALGIALTRSSPYQLDRTQPFAIPIAVPDSVPILRQEAPNSLSSSGGGVSIATSFGSWKTALYGLWGRNPLPTVFARVDPASGAPEVRVENERVAMAAVSAQGTIDALDALIKTEAAYYYRVDDRCEGATMIAPGTPSCFYLRRVPTARATAAIERRLFEGLDAHLQFITEFTRDSDVPALPPAATGLAPGLFAQHQLNPIVTLRLTGLFDHNDFRPTAFVYWSIADRDGFANFDLEYHVADGFALSVGGFWFEGYDSDPAKNRFTIAGSIEGSSNVYLRATAWF